jgi:hypothetical protein
VHRFVTVLILASFTPFWCSAQQSTRFGALAGTVTDNTHLPIAEAAIIAVNPGTGEGRRAVTAENGDFQIIGLPVGTYDVRVNAPGFADYTHTGVVLAMRQTVRLAVALVPSQVQDSDHRNDIAVAA